ncbi:MAG: MBL fold metallo-hydrolase [Gammaproteobacteria bacterium]|nr:MBL fold metallo-hydrolase [Gammaproteobacteria bacterium]
MSSRSFAGLLGITLLAFGSAHGQDDLPVAVQATEIVQIKLSWSNAFLIKAQPPVLVDAGSPSDLPEIERVLAAHGVKLADIALVIPTHGHSDHAGAVAQLQRASSARVALGKGDVPMAKAGHNDDLKPTNFIARLLKRFAIDPNYEPFVPDIIIDGSLDLAPWGIQGKVLTLPGHTPGSVVVVLDDGRALVGDMILGGYFGGALFPQRAGQHYFHADVAANLENIKTLLKLRTKMFYLGHGGPVTREAVLEGFDLVDPLAEASTNLGH